MIWRDVKRKIDHTIMFSNSFMRKGWYILEFFCMVNSETIQVDNSFTENRISEEDVR